MPDCLRSPEDEAAPPHPSIRNYYEFQGERLTAQERADLFRGDPIWLRRVAEIAVGSASLTQPDSHTTAIDPQFGESEANLA